MSTRSRIGWTVFLASTASALAQEQAPKAVEGIEKLWFISPLGAVVALLFSFVFYRKVVAADEGTDRMKEIAGHVRQGAKAYLASQYRTVSIVMAALFVIFVLLACTGLQNPLMPLAFVMGGFFSALCGNLGMNTATMASNRTAQGASVSLNDGLQVAFRSGAVMGLVVVGFGLLNIWGWYIVLDKVVYSPAHMAEGWGFLVSAGTGQQAKLLEMTTTMLGFAFGASTLALFARVGGGIFTKAADVGADLVGKVEAGIPEDDPRNPATIADNVGDNVGDVAGMGADLYESYCGSILATAALGASLPLISSRLSGSAAVQAPMIVAGLGILLSVAGIFLVRCGEESSMKALLKALERGTWGSTGMIIVALGVLAGIGMLPWGIFGAIVAGLLSGAIIGWATGYYTSDEYAPTKGIVEQAKTGPATVIISGLAVGMESAAIPAITIVVGILCAYGFAGGMNNPVQGLYGIGFAAVGMLATLGITLATDAYGPIADNAGGNAEMSGLDPKVRERTDALDMLGNTTAAMGKGFAIGSAALTALTLLGTYIMGLQFWARELDMPGAAALRSIRDSINFYELHIMNPKLICGLFLGAMMALVFCALTMKAVGRAAGAMVEEVRRQFREIEGIMEGTGQPDYQNCVRISTVAAQKEMVLPSLLAIVVPVVVGLVLGVAGVMGLLAGSLAAGFSLACMLNNAGGAWDNAKKYVEKGHLGGKGSEVHKALVAGDTVGDPFKDTSGPSLNILLKLMSMVCVIFAPVIVKFSPAVQSLIGL